MGVQEKADSAEAASIARFMVMREAFGVCWGVRQKPAPITKRKHLPDSLRHPRG